METIQADAGSRSGGLTQIDAQNVCYENPEPIIVRKSIGIYFAKIPVIAIRMHFSCK